jgi:murein DD-endopeptidase MepM/ murein hydrolase activator NlpD
MLLRGIQRIDKKNHPVSAQNVKEVGQEKIDNSLSQIKSLLPDNDRTRVSSDYGIRQDPFTGDLKFHYGLDIPAQEGTPVHPVRKGTVVFSGEQPGYGNVVIIDHGDGFMTKYAHNMSNLVQRGEEVTPGSVIAQVGCTGKSTGSHLHFEVLYKGKHVDPRLLLA